jgi:hypothetical protein
MSDELEYSKKIAILDESDISLPDKANLEFVANQIADLRANIAMARTAKTVNRGTPEEGRFSTLERNSMIALAEIKEKHPEAFALADFIQEEKALVNTAIRTANTAQLAK